MPAVDLAAIRARHAEFVRRHEHTALRCCSAHAAADDVPVLLGLVDQLAVHVADLGVRLDRANERTATKRRELMAARRDVEQANAERDHWVGRFYESVPQRHVVGADCPVDGCGGERVELHVTERADPVAVRLTCGHDGTGGSEPPKPAERATPHATPAKPSH